MNIIEQLEELEQEAVALGDYERVFQEYCNEKGNYLLKEVDPISYSVGLSEFRANLIYEIENKLNDINYQGNNKDALDIIENIEYFVDNY